MNEMLFDLVHKTEDPDTVIKNLEQRLETITKKSDKIIAAAPGYLDSVPDKKTAEHYISHHSKPGQPLTSSKRSGQLLMRL